MAHIYSRANSVMGRNREYEHTKMPWGKYKGRWLSELPDLYLIWCVKNWKDPGTSIMFKVELARRKIKLQ